MIVFYAPSQVEHRGIEESKWKFVSVPIQNNPITDCIYNPAIELEPNIIPFNSIKFENQKNSVEFY